MSFNQYPKFHPESASLIKKHLNINIFSRLKDRETSSGYTLERAINSGLVNKDSNIGIYAGDAESYQLFSLIFDPVIRDYHKFGADDRHKSDLNPPSEPWQNPDPEGKYIISTRIRVGRNLEGLPLGPAISHQQRNDVEQKVSEALKNLTGELAGKYYPLSGLSESDSKQLIDDHFLFKSGDRFLEAAGLNRDWPDGRGIFHNNDKTFLVWVNEEDQLRIISMQNGGDIYAVFSRLCSAVSELSETLIFLCDERLGYLTSCPTNLGTAMRASVHIRLPKLAKKSAIFKQITDEHYLQIRGIHGEHTESEEPVFDISNKRRLGVSETELVHGLYNGVIALIKKEKELK